MSTAPLDRDAARRMLRAYEQPNSVVVASIVLDLTGAGPRPSPACGCCDGPETTRDTIAQAWAARFSPDAAGTGGRSIRTRLRGTLAALEAAGMIRRAGLARQRVIVVDPARLAMAAGNLRILCDPATGQWLGPERWRELPAVPDELLEAQIDRVTGVRRDG